jgi:hypothetical protein
LKKSSSKLCTKDLVPLFALLVIANFYISKITLYFENKNAILYAGQKN